VGLFPSRCAAKGLSAVSARLKKRLHLEAEVIVATAFVLKERLALARWSFQRRVLQALFGWQASRRLAAEPPLHHAPSSTREKGAFYRDRHFGTLDIVMDHDACRVSEVARVSYF
jgi:hypothetical protein